MPTSTLLRVAALSCALAGSAFGSTIRLDDATVASADELKGKVPDSLVAEIAELQAGLGAGPLGATLSIHAFAKAPDVLVVATIDAGRAHGIAQKVLAARNLLHEHYLDPPNAPKSLPPPPAGVERPATALVFEPESVTVPSSGTRRAKFASAALKNGDGVPFEAMVFDVSATLGRIVEPDADPAREGHQLATSKEGVLAFEVDFGGEVNPRTGLVEARGAKDPALRAFGEFTCLMSGKDPGAPYVTVVYLLRDKPEDFTAVSEHLSKAKRLGPLQMEQRTAAGKKGAAGKTFPVVPTMNYAYPPIAIVPDRKQQGEFERWETANQAIHQAIHPMVTARYGQLPYWAEEAIAWDMEEEVTGSLWSFCGYRGFIFDADHKGWGGKARAGVTSPADLKLADVFEYRGEPISRRAGGAGGGGAEMTFDVAKFARAWALMRCFSRDEKRNAGLRSFLLAMGNAKPGQAGPPLPLLQKHVGADAEQALFDALMAGKAK